MSKATKAEMSGMIGSVDGIGVVKEGAEFLVAMGFSSTLVGKMKSVPGAEFEKDKGWVVPEASGKELAAAIADMRDFVKNNGVQVKDVEGGKAVVFDFNKDLNRVIGEVSGAEFKKDVGAWVVPNEIVKWDADKKAKVTARNPALVGKMLDGVAQTPYIDLAVNKMRGILIQKEKDGAAIIDLAKASPALAGATIAPVYVKPNQSYTGPVIAANSNFVAQLTGEKDGSAFVAIHESSDKAIGDLNKGDDVHIDYDGKMNAEVRSTALYKQQGADRAALTAKAGTLIDGPVVMNASTKDAEKYAGSVKGVADTMVLLSAGRGQFSMHRRDLMENGGAGIQEGQNLEISYKGGRANVVDVDKQKAAKGVER